LISEKIKKTDSTRLFSNEDRLGERIPPSVDVYHDVSLSRIIVEVRAADQVGLLHLIAKTISRCGFSIQFARVATEQEIATDVFNIEMSDNNKSFSPSQFLKLREELNESLNAGKYYLEV
jgi:[protein-PII] uridylyltransferase